MERCLSRLPRPGCVNQPTFNLNMAIHILGIRHHGPGSAKNVKAFLEEIQPDIILVEGPPEADPILQWAAHPGLKPPVAILCFQPDNPQHSSFYPFAAFSPEWQAIQYGKRKNIHVRFMDLPTAHQFAVEAEKEKNRLPEENAAPVSQALFVPAHPIRSATGSEDEMTETAAQNIPPDPISWLARAAGFSDGEKWWEIMFEHRDNNEAIFEAVQEAMQELRNNFEKKNDKLEQLREAHMRKMIRQAEKEMFQQIAVICGAWHAPALMQMPPQKEDNELLKGLPKVKTECTWIPWTYDRLSFYSGYGAGIASPGWYDHIWHHPSDNGTLWMAKVAALFRSRQMDTSVAHVIEAVRLAGALAALRELSKPGLEELTEATLSVLCNGDDVLLSLVKRELIISNRIGEVPDDVPRPPLQLDIEKTQKRLRLPPAADWKDYTLDLRKETDLERSIFLHRLQLLEIPWGSISATSGKGTFKEQWRLQWEPGFAVTIIERGSYGNTTAEAASKFVIEKSETCNELNPISSLLESCIPAELPEAVEKLISRINHLAAATGDVMQLMEVVPPLVNITRYGNVRKTDAALVRSIVTSLITRICISLPAACCGIDEDTGLKMLSLFRQINDAISLLQEEDITQEWQKTLRLIAAQSGGSPVTAGYATRLLADYKLLTGEELIRAFYFTMSTAAAPAIAAAWLEGFLKGSGTLLLLDNDIWSIINNWLKQLDEENFIQVLPLLRRTFSGFTTAERRKLGEKAKAGGGPVALQKTETGFDENRALQGMPVILELLGYKKR